VSGDTIGCQLPENLKCPNLQHPQYVSRLSVRQIGAEFL
jgi:hypothetical protein